MGESQPETVAAIHKLKQDIDSLSEQQAEALKTATFVGMTSDEVIEYDKARRENNGIDSAVDIVSTTQ